jgi:predicted nuclease of predicted toxin-antitoxin system
MKILADHCVPPSLVNFLRGKGFQIILAKKVELDKASDERIFNYALKNSLTIFTFDHDFGNISKFDIKRSYGIVIVYVEKMDKATIFKRSLEFFSKVDEQKLRGRLFIIEPERIRKWPR